MKLDKELIIKVKETSKRAGGYLTIELYDKNRSGLSSWKTLKKLLNISFSDFLISCGVMDREEYLKSVNKIKAISNLKLLNLEHGEVSKILYESSNPSLLPSYDYIIKHYGWSEIVNIADVKMANAQYLLPNDAVKELKETIKNLGYIPTSKEYDRLNLKPSPKVLRGMGLSWADGMRKAGYRPYGKTVVIKDKVCAERNCFRQFSPKEEAEIYCESCYKMIRQKIVNDLEIKDADILRDIYTSTSQGYVIKNYSM